MRRGCVDKPQSRRRACGWNGCAPMQAAWAWVTGLWANSRRRLELGTAQAAALMYRHTLPAHARTPPPLGRALCR